VGFKAQLQESRFWKQGRLFALFALLKLTISLFHQLTSMAHQIILTDQAPAPIGPYSQAVKAGNTVYVSGQIPLDASGQLVPGDIAAQTHQVLKNLTAILTAAGFTLADVVKCSIFVKNLGDFAAINQVYGSYFDEATAPARETVEVARLPRDVQVEISCIAVGA
jgi:2-iminobutanoate/2-iminopropanoate deaminase